MFTRQLPFFCFQPFKNKMGMRVLLLKHLFLEYPIHISEQSSQESHPGGGRPGTGVPDSFHSYRPPFIQAHVPV